MDQLLYLQSDVKILTGLVESHFMAGVSGGRNRFVRVDQRNGNPLVPRSRSDGSSQFAIPPRRKPAHEESLAFANMAESDFIVNVTLDHAFKITGIFAGDMEAAHLAAFEMIRDYARIPLSAEADIVITHAGFVGINHYQSAKAVSPRSER